MEDLHKDFKKYLLNEFDKTNKADNTEDLSDFLDYLIEHHFIESSEVLYYLILGEYEQTKSNEGKVSEMVKKLAKKYDKSERTVWDIIIKGKKTA